MEKEELKQKVDLIIAGKGDNEMAHGREDDLHLEVINKFCPEWVKEEIQRLTDTEFARWYA